MHQDLRRMAAAMRKLGISGSFPLIHHFSQQRAFNTGPLTLAEFEAYSKKVSSFQPDGENVQTICRGLAVVASVERGQPLRKAIDYAWNDYPLKTR